MSAGLKVATQIPGDQFWRGVVNPETRGEFVRYATVIAAGALAVFIMYNAYGDPEASTKNFNYYLIMGILPTLIGLYVASPLFSDKLTPQSVILHGGALLALLIGLYLYYRIANPGGMVSSINQVLAVLAVLGGVVGLAILYRVFARYISTMRGWSGLFMRLLFFVPCLISDFAEAVFAEMKLAPNIVVVLFVVEIFIILGYLYIPRLMGRLYSSDRVVLMTEPAFLDRSRVVAKSETFILASDGKTNPGREDGTDSVRLNYSIDFWVNINPMPANHGSAYMGETTVLSYGMPQGSTGGGSAGGKPIVKYLGGNLLVYLTNASANAQANVPDASIPVAGQKWNYVAITYNDMAADVFVNGDLAHSLKFSAQTAAPSYSATDVIQVGQGDGTARNKGLYGAICNVSYHRTPMTQPQIVAHYNAGRYQSPPTI